MSNYKNEPPGVTALKLKAKIDRLEWEIYTLRLALNALPVCNEVFNSTLFLKDKCRLAVGHQGDHLAPGYSETNVY